MRKDDIIGQKLFETCKLSEFYLNLVVNCKTEDESPFQLARAYKQKLYEIVERYDRLLNSNRQRQQLSLTFDKHAKKLYQDSSLTMTRTSTPTKTPIVTPNGINNLFNCSQQTPVATTPSSYATTPTTPYYQQQKHFSFRQNSFNQTGRSFLYAHNSSKFQNQQRTKQPINQQLHHSSLNKTSKLLQQYAFVYDDYDSADDEEHEYNTYSKSSKYSPSKTSSGSQTAALSFKLNYEAYSNTFNKLTRTSSAYAVNQDETVEEYDEDVDDEEFNTELSESQIIEKSYSNLSKDSGVFADSYHSDYSNCLIGIGSEQNKHGESLNKRDVLNKDEITDFDSTSSSSNKTLDEDYQVENKTIISQDENDTVIDEQIDETQSSKLIWGSISRLVEASTFNDLNKKNFMSSTPINRPTAVNNEHLVKTTMKNLIKNYDYNQTNTQDSLMIMDNLNNPTDTNHLCADYLTYYSAASPLSSSSPSSSTTIKTKSNLEDSKTNKELKFLNANSLMNVSMLDNIQATNTQLDFDNMNSSILMFN